ncbi:MAG: hypothetical protein ABEI86_01260, partial [Halobacteriaceae archaeon]
VEIAQRKPESQDSEVTVEHDSTGNRMPPPGLGPNVHIPTTPHYRQSRACVNRGHASFIQAYGRPKST